MLRKCLVGFLQWLRNGGSSLAETPRHGGLLSLAVSHEGRRVEVHQRLQRMDEVEVRLEDVGVEEEEDSGPCGI